MVEGIYIHIPFCHQICHYCDFNKVFIKNQPVDEYIEALGKEMSMLVDSNLVHREVKTIFLGGGTPTALSEIQLSRLLELINEHFDVANVSEFTSEANPDELTIEKIRVMKAGGINRLSLGVQTFNPELLKRIGRTHENDDVFKTIENAKRVGFENISIDLMYGLPGQTMEDWVETLDIALRLDLPHYSAYSLIVEPKTVFYNLMNKGKLSLPGEDLEAEMYAYLMEQMSKFEKVQYEISNFAKKDFESYHNLIYWNNVSYAGIGAGAHGYLSGVRYSNIGPLKKYIEAIEQGKRPILQSTEVTELEKIEEELFLGLRKLEGVSSRDFEKKFGKSINDIYPVKIEQLINKGLLTWEDDYLRLTRKGLFLGNEVFQEFLLK